MKVKQNAVSMATTAILIIAALYTVFPVYMAVVNSFKTQSELYSSVLSFPSHITLENYRQAFIKMDFVRVTFNTLVITVGSVAGIILAGSLAGYKLARVRGRVSSLLYILFTASMLVPFQSIMIPLVKIAKFFDLNGSVWGLPLIYIGLGVNMAIFLYYGFAKLLPKELEEAALVDGCNQFQMFFYIVFPLLKPITATIAILDVLWIWNDFLLPLVMISNVKNYTLILASNMFFGKYNVEWPNILAALVLTLIPVVIFYSLFQKNIIKGITSGAVKG
ncbi:Hypothetical protein LUCI_0930 [Lucifera butyrica]|uniref:ABC transmembrane type-1 domain-containing protein n=1 Tax=Lucifera butyrica TaxID=1351585 RepID=A0A498R3F8_9FIRM|nr:carbohydrate ABC transporter permease [Lucifera butyrica]VBB05719.1 Hypothetical protein LUCI_0930 [Lucifera butyrica]